MTSPTAITIGTRAFVLDRTPPDAVLPVPVPVPAALMAPVSLQVRQTPPQSTPVSRPFLTPSLHRASIATPAAGNTHTVVAAPVPADRLGT